MMGRPLCIVLATSLGLSGCGSKKKEALRLFEIKHSTYGCVIRETSPCPAGSKTCSNDAYADSCDQSYSVAKKEKEIELVAMIPSGTCYMRPADCTKVDCLQAEVPCPPGPEKAMPPKSGQWQIEKTGAECHVTPKNPTYKSVRVAPYDMPCPGYPDNTVGVRRGVGENKGRCQIDDGSDCAPGDATCTAPPAVYVACPPQ